MTLVSLVYVSFATRDMTDADLQDILKVAREKNKTLDVTGMLLYRDGFFIQALEGEREVVDALFAKIAADPRHRNVLLVYENEIEQRSFSQWVMGFNRLTDTDFSQFEGYVDFLNHPDPSFFVADRSRAALLLENFRERSYF